MLTIKDIESKIQDISNKYISGNPCIHVQGLMDELKATEGEIMPHLEELHTQGIITFLSADKDVLSLNRPAKK